MIEKKISYSINIEKPSKTKPVEQGGVLNYLGKQKTVNAPVKWRSSPKHPVAHLSYITKDEEKILIDLNLYGSLKGKPNKGPFGLPSLQGSGGGAGGGDGDGGGDSGGDSGGQSGAQSGDNTDGNNADGTEGGPGTDGMGGPGGFGGDDSGMGVGGSEGFDSQTGPTSPANTLGQTDTFASDVDETAAVAPATGIMNTLTGLAQRALDAYVTYSPAINAIKGVVGFVDSISRGVRGPDDYSQLETSVQMGPPPSATESSGTGIVNLVPEKYQLYYETPPQNLDEFTRRIRLNLGLPI